MTTAETIYAALCALLAALIGAAVWTDHQQAETCRACLERFKGRPGPCCVTCGRCDQCEPRAGPETDERPPPDNGSGHGSQSADRGGSE